MADQKDGGHAHNLVAAAELCGLVTELDDGDHGPVERFAVVLCLPGNRLKVVASSDFAELEKIRRVLIGGAQMVLASMPAPSGTRN